MALQKRIDVSRRQSRKGSRKVGADLLLVIARRTSDGERAAIEAFFETKPFDVK
jgi:hypothetical protein